MRGIGLVVIAAWCALVPSVAAQDAGIAPERDPELEAFRRMVDADPFAGDEHDPIGASASDREIHAMPLPTADEIVAPRIPPQRGEIVTAISGVRMTEHHADVELREGIAIARERITLTSSARVPAEVELRLAVPRGAALVALEVCDAAGCRVGLADRGAGPLGAYDDAVRASAREGAARLPIAHARMRSDDRGEAIVARAAPIVRAPLELRVTWALRTPVRGGRARFVVPARGNDGRAVETRWSVRAIDLVAPAIDGLPQEGGVETRSPGAPVTFDASLPITAGMRASATVVPCAAGRCARWRAVAGRARIAPGDVIVAIDASPSTMATARGRIAPAVRTLLAMLPSSARVRVVAFAARAEEVGEGWRAPTEVDAAAVERAIERPLGSATRVEALWSLVEPWARRGTRLVVVGDGGLTESEAGARALASLSRAGVMLASIDVADRASTPALRAALDAIEAVVIDAGEEAERAAAGRGTTELVARMSAALTPVVARRVTARVGSERYELGALREGEERTFEAPSVGSAAVSIALDGTSTRSTAPIAELGPALTALTGGGAIALAAIDASDVAREGAGSCHVRGPYASNSGVGSGGEMVAVAETRRCNPPAETQVAPTEERRTGVPARVLLQSLRRRVIPPARACFRADRAGRAAYQERAELRIELADREIVAARVEGAIEESLRACLLSALDGLDVPGFSGRIIATWPLYTAPTLPPPVLELAPDVASEVDRALPAE